MYFNLKQKTFSFLNWAAVENHGSRQQEPRDTDHLNLLSFHW